MSLEFKFEPQRLITKIGARLLIGLMVAWTLVVLPDLVRTSPSPIAGAADLLLGCLWIGAVPGAFYLAARFGLRSPANEQVGGLRSAMAIGLAGGFIVSYAVLAYYVGLGALTVLQQGGMYESNLLWAFAPFVAGKFSALGVLAGLLVGGFAATRHVRV